MYSVREQIKNQDSDNSIITEHSGYNSIFTAYMFIIHIAFHKKFQFKQERIVVRKYHIYHYHRDTKG
jgi:hypothetical protein